MSEGRQSPTDIAGEPSPQKANRAGGIHNSVTRPFTGPSHRRIVPTGRAPAQPSRPNLAGALSPLQKQSARAADGQTESGQRQNPRSFSLSSRLVACSLPRTSLGQGVDAIDQASSQVTVTVETARRVVGAPYRRALQAPICSPMLKRCFRRGTFRETSQITSRELRDRLFLSARSKFRSFGRLHRERPSN